MPDSMRLPAVVEVALAHRSIGQERLCLASETRLASLLDGLSGMLNWTEIAGLLTEATPERTAFVRNLKALVGHSLDRLLFERVTAQLKAKAITVKTGMPVDATIIASASEEEGEARWVKHKESPPSTASKPLSELMPSPQ